MNHKDACRNASLNNIVICEGSEKVGKTTFVKDFSKAFGYKVYKGNHVEDISTVKPEDILKEWVNFLEAYEPGDRVIIDRGHPSEYVYGKLFRKYDSNHLRSVMTIDKLFAGKATVIHCYCSDLAEWQRRFRLEDKIKDFQKAVKIEDVYEQFYNGSSCDTIYWDMV